MSRTDGDVGLSGDRLASTDVNGVEVGREGWGVYGKDICRGGERYGDAGGLGGDMRVIAVAMREGGELEEEARVCEAWEICQLVRIG